MDHAGNRLAIVRGRYAVVAWFMSWVRTRGFTVFAVYRILLGAFVLWYAGSVRWRKSCQTAHQGRLVRQRRA